MTRYGAPGVAFAGSCSRFTGAGPTAGAEVRWTLGRYLTLFGGVPSERVETPAGFKELGIETVPPLLGRGVLLDVAGWMGVPELPASYAISDHELAACAAGQKVEVRPGDVLLVRTGYGAHWDDEARYLKAAGVAK